MFTLNYQILLNLIDLLLKNRLRIEQQVSGRIFVDKSWLFFGSKPTINFLFVDFKGSRLIIILLVFYGDCSLLRSLIIILTILSLKLLKWRLKTTVSN